jgi:ankyrin repeat protein
LQFSTCSYQRKEDLFAGIEYRPILSQFRKSGILPAKSHPWGVFAHAESNAVFLENVDKRDRLGFNALQVATTSNLIFAANALIHHGMDLNEVEPNLNSPLHVAATKNHIEIARMLIEAGAHLNERDKHGDKPLHVVATKNHFEIARMLIQAGAYLLRSDSHGRSALDLASVNNHSEIEIMLLNAM